VDVTKRQSYRKGHRTTQTTTRRARWARRVTDVMSCSIFTLPTHRSDGPSGRTGSIFDGGVVALDVDHLAATVVAILGDMVTQVGFTTGRIGSELLGGQRVMGAAHAAAGRGLATFLDSHGKSSSNQHAYCVRTTSIRRFFQDLAFPPDPS